MTLQKHQAFVYTSPWSTFCQNNLFMPSLPMNHWLSVFCESEAALSSQQSPHLFFYPCARNPTLQTFLFLLATSNLTPKNNGTFYNFIGLGKGFFCSINCTSFVKTKEKSFYNIKKGWSIITSKSSSNNLSNENKHLCFCCLLDKT